MIIIPKKFNKIKQNNIDLCIGEWYKLITPDIVPNVYDYYLITNFGRVYHRYLSRFLKPGISGSGYRYVMMSTDYGPKPIQIHRVELMAFKPIENMNMYQVNHIDGNKFNNDINNLEWVTRSQNIKHAYDIGLKNKGQYSEKTNLTNCEVEAICNYLSQNKFTNKEISQLVGHGVTESIVSSIKERRSWVDISKDYTFYSRTGALFTADMVENICQYFCSNKKDDTISANEFCKNTLIYLGYPYDNNYVDSCRKIYSRKYYTDISNKYIF